MRLSAKERDDMVRWARGAVHGLDESAIFVGIFDDRPMDATRIEFTLQIGHALLTEKPIVLTVPHGMRIPPKLEAVADRIVRYDPDDMETIQRGLVQALTELGVNKQ